MTKEKEIEAIDYITGQLKNGYIDLGRHDEYELELVEQAIKKQIPQKPIGDAVFYLNELYCPSCRKFLGFPHNTHPNFCGKCGQALDWSE